MKKYILILMVLVGIGLMFSNLQADEARTIPHKSKAVVAANTVVKGSGGTLYIVTGYASSANAVYGIFDYNSTDGLSSTNTIAEGGEATQYDSFDTLDFGPEGLPFNTGLTVATTTAYVIVIYD